MIERLDSNSPHFFGSEGVEPQRTRLACAPLEISLSDYEQLKRIAEGVSQHIDGFPFVENTNLLGANFQDVNGWLRIDGYANKTRMVYGGLDLYRKPSGKFVAVEINARPQAMGLQDFRQDELGITSQPKLINQFTGYLAENGYNTIAILASRSNPFYRGYLHADQQLCNKGFKTVFTDAQSFCESVQEHEPDCIWRLADNRIFLAETGKSMVNYISRKKVPIINPLIAALSGYRGYLPEVARKLPDFFPRQILINHSDQLDKDYPWLKLEHSGDRFVVNILELRNWARKALKLAISGEYDQALDSLREKNGSDAARLKETILRLKNKPEVTPQWVCQEDIPPSWEDVKLDSGDETMAILYRLYWINTSGGVDVSFEAFGCDREEFSRSKGKINAGSGVAIPITVN